jgi:hypothetical protein
MSRRTRRVSKKIRPRPTALSASTARTSRRAAKPSLAWLLSGDRSGMVGRSLAAACAGALIWTIGLHLAENRLAPDETSPAVVEQLLLDVEDSGARQFAPRLFAGRLPADLTMPIAVRRAIDDAAESVGIDSRYLVAVAALESSFDASAQSQRSSAAGLYQFTEDTWLRVVKVFGAKHGLADAAASISVGERGAVSMLQGDARHELMQRRYDPQVAAVMAAELAIDNKRRIERVLGRPITPAETYIGHFLGVSQAARVIDAAYSRPHFPGARLVPAAAAANPEIFRPAGQTISAGALVAGVEDYFRRDVPRFAGI